MKIHKLALHSVAFSLLIISCTHRKTNTVKSNSIEISSPILDTNLIKAYVQDNFTFSIKGIKYGEFGIDEKVIADAKLHNSDSSIYLFECHPLYGREYYLKKNFLQHEDGEIWSFPYYTGGNYCRSVGIELIRINSNRIKYLGPVSGFADIDSSGVKQFYVNVVVDMHKKSCSEYVVEKWPVTILNDTIAYPFSFHY